MHIGGTLSPPSASALVVGNLRLEGKALLAPMAGVTDAGMRRIARSFGATLTISEMVAANGLSRGENESLVRAEAAGVSPHAVQIAGCRAEDMAEAARLVEACGADLVDINMGCPAKRVTGGLAGSALMRDLDHATSLIRATVSAVKVPVSVKMRLGWDETSINAPDLARRAEGEGACMVTVHGRTRSQFYKGKADWSAVRAVREQISIPLVVNGDCLHSHDAARMLELSGADAVMVGRAAIGQPWLVGDIALALDGQPARPAPTAAQRLAVILEHYEALLLSMGRMQGNRHARKHLAASVRCLPATPDTLDRRLRLVTSDQPAEVVALLHALFDVDAQERHPHVIAT